MDGRFVPNITIGPVVLKSVRAVTAKPLSVHLMIVEPERYIEAFAEAGADHLLIQAEQASTIHLHRTLQHVSALGRKAGVVIDPAKPVVMIEHVLHMVEVVLLMTGLVNSDQLRSRFGSAMVGPQCSTSAVSENAVATRVFSW